MNALRKIRLILLAVFGVPALLFCGVMAARQYLSGEGDIHLVAPEDGPLAYVLDGAKRVTLSAGQHVKLSVPQGAHHLSLSSGEEGVVHLERDLKIDNGFAELLVPVSRDQCFVVLDVSHSHYGPGADDVKPTIERRVSADQPADVPSAAYFSEAELPHSIKENSHCRLVEQVDCSLLGQPDDRLVLALGY